jgi:hypothetical protein
VDELRLFLGGHGLEGRDLVVVFFKLGDVVAADDDVRKRKGMRDGETQKGFPTGVSWQAGRIAAKIDTPSYGTHVLFCYPMAFPIEKASPIYAPAL